MRNRHQIPSLCHVLIALIAKIARITILTEVTVFTRITYTTVFFPLGDVAYIARSAVLYLITLKTRYADLACVACQTRSTGTHVYQSHINTPYGACAA